MQSTLMPMHVTTFASISDKALELRRTGWPALQVATQAVARMPGLLVFPVLPAAATSALLLWWLFVSAYIYGSGGRFMAIIIGNRSVGRGCHLPPFLPCLCARDAMP